MKNKELIMDKVMNFAGKVQDNLYLSSISQGLMGIMPISMIGSITLLLAVLPITAWKDFISDAGIRNYFFIAQTLTTNLISLYAVFGISYKLAVKLKCDGLTAGMISLFCFLMMTPMVSVDGASYLNTGLLGAKGLFTAMIIGLSSSRLYCLMIEKKIVIKMPEGVPQFVSNTIGSLIPTITIGLVYLFISFAFSFTKWGSFSECVYAILAMPLENLSASLWSMVFIVLVQMILWSFGLHGSMVVSAFISALYLPMNTENMELVAQGAANSELNILCQSFYSLFAGIGGAGGTLSLIILLLLMGKSKKGKAMGTLSVVPGLFTINEPIVFGYPMILNPIMAIPFILVPIAQVVVAYLAMASGIVPRLLGVSVPFGVPVIISGFIGGGWKVAVLQVVVIIVGMIIYYPFFKIADNRDYKEEQVV